MTKRPRTARRHDQSRGELKSGRCSAGCSAVAVAHALDGRTPAWRRPATPGARIPATRWLPAVARAGRSASAHDPTTAWWDGSARGSAPDPPCQAHGTAVCRWSPGRSRRRFPVDTGMSPSRTAGTAVRSARVARSSDDGGGTETAWVGDDFPERTASRPARMATAYALFSAVAPHETPLRREGSQASEARRCAHGSDVLTTERVRNRVSASKQGKWLVNVTRPACAGLGRGGAEFVAGCAQAYAPFPFSLCVALGPGSQYTSPRSRPPPPG